MVITIMRDDDRAYAIEHIKSHDLPFEITVQDLNVTRSIKQNALMWMWYTDISKQFEVEVGVFDDEGNFLGTEMRKYSKEDWHDLCRMKFLGVKTIILGHKEYPRPAVSTRKLSVKKMSDYLLDIESHFVAKGVALTFPDYYGEAMGTVTG